MARPTYGNTWWGQQWLNALTNIDYSNRLPRGKSYANKGLVLSTEVSGNHILAKVQGSAPRPYKVEITVPRFAEADKKSLVDRVAENPALVAQLLNRELPPGLLQFAEKQGIKVFPRTWRDFGMSCSCPDYAVPCKHLAAVVYTAANEIDTNPFLVFELHGLDFVKELESRNIQIAGKKEERIQKVADLLGIGDEPIHQFTNSPIHQPLDFTTIPEAGSQILTLFKPQPLFYDKDFKEIIVKLYNGAMKAGNKMVRGSFVTDTRKLEFEASDSLHLVFDENLYLKTTTVRGKNGKDKPQKFNDLRYLIASLYHYDAEQLQRSHPTIAALMEVFNFSIFLVKNGAIMPQLLDCGGGGYRVRWLPAVIVEEVRVLFEKLADLLPPVILSVEKKGETFGQKPKEMLNSLCSLFLGHCINEAAWHEEHPLPKLFFWTTDSKPTVFDKIKQHVDVTVTKSSRGYGYFGDFQKSNVKTKITGHKIHPDTPQLLQLWLNNFYLTHKDLVPLVKVEDLDGGFSVELMVEYRPEPLRAPVPLGHIFTKKQYAPVKFDVLKDVLLLAEFFPGINRLVESQGRERLVYDAQAFVEVLLKILPAVGLFGIRILLPRGLKHLVRPQASLLAKRSPGKDEGSFLSFNDLMAFDWQIALGDQLVPVREFEQLVRNLNGIVKINDQYILVDEDELVKLFQKLEEPPMLKGFEALQVLLAEEYQGAKIGLTDEAAALIRRFIQPEEVPLPEGLNATLRPYQRSGYDWMLKNTRIGFGSLLADDMGLGKTLQVIAALLRFKEEGKLAEKKALVIVPTSLLTNWRKEIEKFAPSLRAAIYHGQNRTLDMEADVILTTYGIARSENAFLKKQDWYCTVIDEAQNIKNAGTEQTKSVKSIPAPVRIAMSGTPVENRLSEFWSIMDFTNKGYLGSPKQFTATFAKPIQREGDQKQAALFIKVTAPFILRRLKSDKSIIADLPDKIENNQFATLTKEQAAVYESVVRQQMKSIFDEDDQTKRQGRVLKMITALKQICNHPHQFLKKGPKTPDLSGKAQLLLDLLDTIYENGEKTLIFTQYQEMGELLVQIIGDTFGKTPLFLHGGTSRPRRDEMVEAFQSPPTFDGENDTFILSLKAGGTGLNLTAASNVIHYDLWWNPAVEAQATDRAYRIGQQRNVMVWRLITQGTFEEKIDEMIRRKKDLANLTVATGESWIGDMTNEELKTLVALG
jgi:uncharacterized Zn finger protein